MPNLEELVSRLAPILLCNFVKKAEDALRFPASSLIEKGGLIFGE